MASWAGASPTTLKWRPIEGRMIKGRRCLYLVYENFRLDEQAGAMYELNDFMAVKLKSDNL